jgi:hypothetical protein
MAMKRDQLRLVNMLTITGSEKGYDKAVYFNGEMVGAITLGEAGWSVWKTTDLCEVGDPGDVCLYTDRMVPLGSFDSFSDAEAYVKGHFAMWILKEKSVVH